MKKLHYQLKNISLLIITSLLLFSFNEIDQIRIHLSSSSISLRQMISEIEDGTSYSFYYSHNDINDEALLELKSYQDDNIQNILEEVSKQLNINYKINGNHILLDKKIEEHKAIIPIAPNVEQDKIKISGVIRAGDDKQPLPSATVLIKGTTYGAVTDMDGNFTIEADKGDVLVFSYTGYLAKEITLTTQSKLDVSLDPDATQLEEVVLVGYTQIKKTQMTGSTSKVNTENLETMPTTSLEERLQGQAPGLLISSGSGQPGSDDVSIRIRGTGSINGSNTPLYIMDGVMVEPAQFAAVNPNDIENINVLKDASATAIYGSRGANGVILITTKQGTAGKTKFNYRTQFGVSTPTKNPTEMMNSEESIAYQTIVGNQRSEYGGNSALPLTRLLYLETKEKNGELTNPSEIAELNSGRSTLSKARSTDTNWNDKMLKPGYTMMHELSASGGNEKTKFFASGNYFSQEGNIENSSIERVTGRLNLTHKASEKLSFGTNLSLGYAKEQLSDPATGEGRFSWMNPFFTTYLAYPFEDPETWNSKDNPYLLTKYTNRTRESVKIIAAAHVDYKFTDWLSFRSNVGTDYKQSFDHHVISGQHPAAATYNGSMSQAVEFRNQYTFTNTLNFNKTINGKHAFNGVVGMEMYSGSYRGMNQVGYDIDDNLWDSPAGIGDKTGASARPPQIGGGLSMNRLMSYFTQWNYTYNNKYNLSASLRHDTSSKFQGDNASALFYSIGGSWNMSQEDAFKSIDQLSMLRLRTSYGTTGNQDGVGDFETYGGYSRISYAGQSGMYHSQIGNPNLKWETSAQFNLGLDFGLFDDRISGSVDYYNITTKDLFMNKQVSLTSGYGSITTNAGSVRNAGIEFAINADVVRQQDFTWNLGFNFTFNKNELLDLGSWDDGSGYFVNGDYIYQEGQSLGTWYMVEWAGINPDNGEVLFVGPGGELTEDYNSAPKSANLGNSEVPFFGGITTNWKYKNLSLSMLFTYSVGNTVMNANRWYIDNPSEFNGNKPKKLLNIWQNPGDITDVPKADAKYVSPYASHFLEDASYLRLKNVRLAYYLQSERLEKVGIRGLNMFVQAQNLFTVTGYTGPDPELSGAYDFSAYPAPRIYTIGFDLSF
ncbi:SusC/RagA family TonB-linked outer membrane protein [Flammeovirga pacifica]|uniref:SusC/RagA family TonB-linked outer membrane protein n=1 Tax=Flammeovirga pacifica TaxID=915059 RepID=A0A1S1YS14_FLAPC|nr:TonB-dependent receptor [Flammeovirga pacifica]OHX63826.1 hypothetical protein NH26_19635 [Flammeovirga pacifica]